MPTLGMNRHPLPRPIQTPWASMTCQYCVHRLTMNMPKTTRKEPTYIKA